MFNFGLGCPSAVTNLFDMGTYFFQQHSKFGTFLKVSMSFTDQV